MFNGTYTKVSALSARSHLLYQNANVFGLKRLFLSAPKVQQLDVQYRDELDLKITGARIFEFQDSLTDCMMQRANRQANPSVGKEHKRFRLQTFAQSEYAVFDETLGWCALGSATGGKHVSAISHSSILPIENHKSENRDRSLKENAPSRL